MTPQDHQTTQEFEAIGQEYSRYRQAAGLPAVLAPTFDRTPDDYRRSQVRRLQSTLPAFIPKSVSSDCTGAPADVFAKTESLVKEAVLKAASAGDTLREVTLQDKTGREITEFYGAKRNWMAQYTAPVLLMKRMGNATY